MSREEVVARVLGVAFAAAVGFVVVIMTACLMSHNRTIVERTPPTVCLPCHPCSIHADWCDPSAIPTVPLSVPPDAFDRHELTGTHFAAFPPALPRAVIDAWSEPGDVVLDPFLGTGTTVMMARAMGRTGWGIDLNEGFLRLAQWRIWESGDWTTDLNERAMIRSAALAGADLLTLFGEA